ncbi:MAG: Crp/Fnr family transcriptional regulator [Pseudomonadota bacterium]
MDRARYDAVCAAAHEESILKTLCGDDGFALVGNAATKPLAKGELLFQQDDDGDFAALILSGAVKVSTFSASGREVVYAYLSAGALVGELSALDGSPRTAAAIVIEKGEAAIIARKDLRLLLEDRPAIALSIIETLCARLRATNALIESDRSFATGPRLARGLLRLLNEHGVNDGGALRVGFKISQSDLGAFVSLSRENVNRQLHEWADAGWVALASGRVNVLDRDALEEIADY